MGLLGGRIGRGGVGQPDQRAHQLVLQIGNVRTLAAHARAAGARAASRGLLALIAKHLITHILLLLRRFCPVSSAAMDGKISHFALCPLTLRDYFTILNADCMLEIQRMRFFMKEYLDVLA